MDPALLQQALQREQLLRAQLDAARQEGLAYREQLEAAYQGPPVAEAHVAVYQGGAHQGADPGEEAYVYPEDGYYERPRPVGRLRGRGRSRRRARGPYQGQPWGQAARRRRAGAPAPRAEPDLRQVALVDALEAERGRNREAVRELRRARADVRDLSDEAHTLRAEVTNLREFILTRGFPVPSRGAVNIPQGTY